MTWEPEGKRKRAQWLRIEQLKVEESPLTCWEVKANGRALVNLCAFNNHTAKLHYRRLTLSCAQILARGI